MPILLLGLHRCSGSALIAITGLHCAELLSYAHSLGFGVMTSSSAVVNSEEV